MDMGTSGYSLADIKSVVDDGDGYGANNWFWIVVLFLFAGGNFGFGGNREQYATQTQLQNSFDTSTIIGKLDGITNGICDSSYALKSAIDACCCENRTALANLGTDIVRMGYETGERVSSSANNLMMAITQSQFANQQGFCELSHAICNSNRDIVDAIRADGEATRALINSNEMARLRDELDQARCAINSNAQSQYILGQLGRYYTNPAYNACCGQFV